MRCFGHSHVCLIVICAILVSDVVAYEAVDVPFHSTAAALIAHLNQNVSFAQLYDKMLKYPHDGWGVPENANKLYTPANQILASSKVKAPGVCWADAVGHKSNGQAPNVRMWGYRLFNYMCAGDTTYDWDDEKPYMFTKIHRSMGMDLHGHGFSPTDDLKACEFVICYKQDEAPLTAGSDSNPNIAAFNFTQQDINGYINSTQGANSHIDPVQSPIHEFDYECTNSLLLYILTS